MKDVAYIEVSGVDGKDTLTVTLNDFNIYVLHGELPERFIMSAPSLDDVLYFVLGAQGRRLYSDIKVYDADLNLIKE